MKNLLALDVFCGSGSFSKVCRSYGIEVISTDIRRRKGVCEPTIRVDLNNVPGTYFSSLPIFCASFGLPCDIWSRAHGGFHLSKDFKPKTQKAVEHIQLLEKTISIINQGNIEYWFIENPRANLVKYPGLKSLFGNTKYYIYECTLSSYGFPTKKPTSIITNLPNLELLALDNFGRGYKNPDGAQFSNMTKVQRQATPAPLYASILLQFLAHKYANQ